MLIREIKKLLLLVVISITLIIGLSDYTGKTETWTNKHFKLVVISQCGVYLKVGIDHTKWSYQDTKFVESAIKGSNFLDNYTKDEIEIVKCCSKKIIREYTQDEYLKKENVTHIIQEALDSCK